MNSIRSITEGAIVTALYFVLLLAILLLPIVGVLFIFLLPLPFIIYVTRHTLKKGLLLLTVALSISYMIDSIAVLPITFIFGTAGLVMGAMYSLRKSAYDVLISGSLSFLLNFVLLYVITNVFFNVNFVDNLKKMMYESLKTAEKMVTAFGESTDQFELMYQSLEMVSYIVPSALAITSVVLAFVTQLFVNQFLKWFKYDFKPFPPLRKWSFPKSILWYYLIVTIIFMIGVEEGTIFFTMIVNLIIVLEVIIAVQGFSFIFFYFFRKGKSAAFPIVIVIVCLLMPFLLYIIRILGIIDLGFDLRKRMKDPQ